MTERTRPEGRPHAAPSAITVFLADAHEVLIEGMRRVLEAEDLEVVGTARDASAALRAVAAARPDVLLIDVEMADTGPGELVAKIRLAAPGTRVLVLSADTRPEAIRAALEAGVDAYIAKDESSRRVVTTIRALAAGHYDQPITHARPRPPRRRDASVELMVRSLSARELTILRHLAAGHSNVRIAKECHLTLNTVRTHIQSILVKLGVHSKVEAVWFAVQHDVVRLTDVPTIDEDRSTG